MKKMLLLLSIFLLALLRVASVQAELITTPGTTDVDNYLIRHVNSNNYLTYSGGNTAPVIAALTDADATQNFQFRLVAGTTDIYNILNVESNKYLARKDANSGSTNDWTMFWVADPNDANNWTDNPKAADVKQNAQFKIVPGSDGTYVSIQNVAGSKYMGTDNDSDGSAAYANKDATSARAKWLLSIPTGETEKDALQAAYDAALNLYNNTEEGNGSNQYPANERTALWNAIQDAEDVLYNPSASQSVVNAAVTALNNALSVYKAAINPFLPDGDAAYYIQSAGGSGCYLTTNGNGNTIVAATYAIDQQFKFVRFQTTEYFYIVKASDPTQLLTRQANGYSLAWGTEQSGLARFRFKGTGDDNYTIECQEIPEGSNRSTSFVGVNENRDGESAYADKDGKDGKHKWKIINIEDVELTTTPLEEAINKAQEDFLDYAQKGNGSDQYPAAEYDALVNAIAAGNAILANTTGITQTQIGNATIAINNALAAVRVLANPFQPNETKNYQIVHYGGMFLGAKAFTGYIEGTDPPSALTLAPQSDADSLKMNILVAASENSVNIQFASVPGKYLTRFTGTQVNNPSKHDDYKLVWLDDAASQYAQFEIKRIGIKDYYTIKCISEGPERNSSYLGTDDTVVRSSVSIDKSGTSTNHYWRVQEFGTTATKSAIVNNVFVSTGNGSLTVNRLEGANRIAIYSIVGQLVASVSHFGSEFETQLPKGIYLVTVNGDSPYSGKAIVK